ncbi:MAG: citramalate synthase [Nitrospirae bacterium]|nr:citramalate synthase [Nitrospirota bacterium]
MSEVKLYDTTLRDGAQAEDVAFLVEDKLRIAEKLDAFGIHYIEGGWPGSNPKDTEFFKKVKKLRLKNSEIVAFGSTRRADQKVAKDFNIRALLDTGTKAVTIVGKTWDLHVTDALRIPLKKNLELIYDSIAYLKGKGRKVFYDAEHFFDGYKANPEYAMQTLEAAKRGGVDCLVLCDTNGGTMPDVLREIFLAVKNNIDVPLGIHAHNDAEMAVANSVIAIGLGAVQVHGTINGIGERCGNANLCSIIPNLKLKLKINCISNEQLKKLKEVSRFVSEIANLSPFKHQPYVGDSAFAHKGGIHVNAVLKNPETYEHIRPELVGNYQRVLVSELSGKSNILRKAKEFRIHLPEESPKLKEILKTLKDLENQGYQFEGAEGSFELLMKRTLGTHKRFFDLIGFRVIVEKRKEGEEPISEATIMLKVGGETEHTAAVGRGPVNALDNALRKALEKFYPKLKEMRLIDYKVRVLAANRGTAARVRVLIESSDKKKKWGTVGVSENIMEASWQALVDSIEYKLMS